MVIFQKIVEVFMDLELEKVSVAKEVLAILGQHNEDCVVVNLLTLHQNLFEFVSKEVKAALPNTIVKHEPELITLPKLLNHVRNEVTGKELLLVNVSHDLGWPYFEMCTINLDSLAALDDREAVHGGDSKVHHGTPFYDDEVL